MTKRFRSSASPIAEPPPAPPQIGATNEPTFRPKLAMWSTILRTAPLSLSMSTCGAVMQEIDTVEFFAVRAARIGA